MAVLSEHLRDTIQNSGHDSIRQRTWIIRLCSKLMSGDIDLPWRDRKNLLGFSQPFKLPGQSISFSILKSGMVDHAVMTCVANSTADLLRQVTERLSKLSAKGKSYDEMLEDMSELDMDKYYEFPEDFIQLTVGSGAGADLYLSHLDLVATNTMTIDHLDFT